MKIKRAADYFPAALRFYKIKRFFKMTIALQKAVIKELTTDLLRGIINLADDRITKRLDIYQKIKDTLTTRGLPAEDKEAILAATLTTHGEALGLGTGFPAIDITLLYHAGCVSSGCVKILIDHNIERDARVNNLETAGERLAMFAGRLSGLISQLGKTQSDSADKDDITEAISKCQQQRKICLASIEVINTYKVPRPPRPTGAKKKPRP